MVKRVTCKLRNVRIAFPHLSADNRDKFGKISLTVLIPKGGEAEQTFKKALRDAWEAGAEACGRTYFEASPTATRVLKMACVKVGGELDNDGKPLPAWQNDFLAFNVQSKLEVSICDSNFDTVTPTDARIYDGQRCHVSFDLVPFYNSEFRKSGISRYLRSVFVVGDGEPIATGSGGFTNAVEEWGEVPF